MIIGKLTEAMKAFPSPFAALLVIGVVSIHAEDTGKHSTQAQQTAKARGEEIRAEIQKLGAHDWAGEYYMGDGLGVNTSLVVAPAAGYVFEWHGCLGLYDRNYGAVTWKEGRLALSFTFPNIRKGFRGIAPELVPIKWGTRRYLISSDAVIGFCNEVNQGGEPRNEVHGQFLLRKGDEKEKVKGFPELPEQYRPFLLLKPVEARITAVGPYITRPSIVDWKFKDTPVTLDAEAKKGLRVGMELVVTQPDEVESVTLTKAEEDHSEGLMTQAGEEEPGPKVGWRLSTQAPWRDRDAE